jgi:uridine kinase
MGHLGSYVRCAPTYYAILIVQTAQAEFLSSHVHDPETDRGELISQSRRLMSDLFEEAVCNVSLSHESYTSTKSAGLDKKGQRLQESSIVGVCILNAGGSMIDSFLDVCKDAHIGKMLIQSDPSSREPLLHYIELPLGVIERSHVFIMDPVILTGSKAIMAIRVLLDHDIQPQNIIFTCLFASLKALCAIRYAFPEVKLVVACVMATPIPKQARLALFSPK